MKAEHFSLLKKSMFSTNQDVVPSLKNQLNSNIVIRIEFNLTEKRSRAYRLFPFENWTAWQATRKAFPAKASSAQRMKNYWQTIQLANISQEFLLPLCQWFPRSNEEIRMKHELSVTRIIAYSNNFWILTLWLIFRIHPSRWINKLFNDISYRNLSVFFILSQLDLFVI